MGYRNNLQDAGEWDLNSSSALSYDAEKVADFIDDLRYVNEKYNDKIGMLGTEYDHYRDNQTFVGRAADASKYAIESKQKGYLHEGVYNIEKAIYDKYCSLDDMFKAMVDPSPKARIDTDVIENIKCDYVRQAETSDIVGRVLENSSRYLEHEFGDLGQVTQINYNGVRAIYDEFNGNGGMLDKCVKRMEDYETEALASVDNSQLDYQVSDLQGAITRAAGGLNDMKTYDPSMPNNTISLVALGANMGGINSFNPTALAACGQVTTLNQIDEATIREIQAIAREFLIAKDYAMAEIDQILLELPRILAEADGPYPVGDLIAIGLLVFDAILLSILIAKHLAEKHIHFSKPKGKSKSKDKSKDKNKDKEKDEKPHRKNKDGEPLGKDGPEIRSKTIFQRGKTERVDVENQNPGDGNGNVHYHDAKDAKYVFDPVDGKLYSDIPPYEVAPPCIQRVLEDPLIQKAIDKALKYLSEPPFFNK
ncbi:MAG: hypothetical protein J5802_00740 [Butyrivibrio sp.]|nr:hypothetical protein [Butyrivibrio sp.]